MKCLLQLLILFFFNIIFSQSAGDILFVGYNASGDSDFSIVAMELIPANTIIYFTDNKPNSLGNGCSGVEGVLKWNSGDKDIVSGRIIVFNDLDFSQNLNFGSSIGELTTVRNGFNISTNGDVIYATYGNPVDNTVTTWISAIQNSSFSVEDNFNLTGLNKSSNYIQIDDSISKAGGQYSGFRSGKTKETYKTLIINENNWYTGVWNGEDILPLNIASFSFLKEADVLYGDDIIITTENNSIIADRGTITSVYNMFGQHVINANLGLGVYIVHVNYKDKIETFKVIVD